MFISQYRYTTLANISYVVSTEFMYQVFFNTRVFTLEKPNNIVHHFLYFQFKELQHGAKGKYSEYVLLVLVYKLMS